MSRKQQILLPTSGADSLDVGRVAFWQLNGDLTSLEPGYDLTNSGVTFTTGLNSQQAGDFETTESDYGALANASLGNMLPGDNSFFLSVWFKLESGSIFQDIMAVYDPTGDNRCWQLRVENTNAPKFVVSSAGTSASSTTATWGSALSIATWYHALCIHDADANTISIAIDNGTPVSQSHTGGAFASSTAEFNLGAEDEHAAGFFDGLIQYAGFWYGRIPTTAEKARLAGTAPYYTGL